MSIKFYLLRQLALVSVVVLCCSCNATQNFKNQTDTMAPGLGDGKAAWGDYDDDGYVDLLAGNKLWRNNSGKGFSVVMKSVSGIWADYDNDGKLDFYKTKSAKLYHNASSAKKTSFSVVDFPKLPLIKNSRRSRGASWADYDNDGNVDLYVGGYEIWSKVTAFYDVVVKNMGASFAITTKLNLKQARGVTSCDFDRDGDQDVYVSNYRLQNNALFLNNGAGVFTNVARERAVDGDGIGPPGYIYWTGGHTIGSAWGDLDNDGYIDLFVGNFSHPPSFQDRPKFYRNLGPGKKYRFEDKSAIAKLAWQESYASPALGDYDNDGDLDLFLTTVYPIASGVANHPVLYRNDGNWCFTDVTVEEGLAKLGSTYQASWADIDNDGDLDLVTDGKLFINNESDKGGNHWLKVKLTGDGVNINAAAIGAEVRVFLDGKVLTRQVEGGTGEGNQNDLTLHFGLGSHNQPVDLEISASGKSWKIKKVPVDQTLKYTIP